MDKKEIKDIVKQHISSILEWVIALYMILSTGSIPMLKTGGILSTYAHWISAIIYCFIALWIIININKIILINIHSFIWIIIVIICLLLSVVSSLSNIFSALIRYYIPCVLGLMIWLLVPSSKVISIIKKTAYVILIICIISIFFWTMGTFFNIIRPNKVILFEWGEEKVANSYLGIYYEPTWQSFSLLGKNIYKNCGIFAEPPMFGFWLSFCYSFYRMSKRNCLQAIILLICICMTINTTSYIYVILFEMVWYVLKQEKSSIKQFTKLFLIIIFGFVAIKATNILINDKLSSGSGMVRSDHLNASIVLFKQTFPFGIGIGNVDLFLKYEKYPQGMSIGLPAIYAQGGIGALIVTTGPIIYLLYKAFRQKEWKWVSFAIAFFWTEVCTTVQLNSPFSFIAIIVFLQGSELFEYKTTNKRCFKI